MCGWTWTGCTVRTAFPCGFAVFVLKTAVVGWRNTRDAMKTLRCADTAWIAIIISSRAAVLTH